MKKPELSEIEKVQAVNIQKKAKSGKVLTAREEAIYAKVRDFQKPSSPEADRFLVDLPFLADLFDVSQKTICEWVKNGAAPKESTGVYHLKKFFDWWQTSINSGKEDNDSSIMEIKKQYWQERVIGERTKNQVRAKELMPVEQIHRDWTERAADLRQSLLALPTRMGSVLENKSAAECQELVTVEMRRILEGFCRAKSYKLDRKKKKK